MSARSLPLDPNKDLDRREEVERNLKVDVLVLLCRGHLLPLHHLEDRKQYSDLVMSEDAYI